MRFARLFTNLGTVLLLTLALVSYALVQWIGSALFEDRYELTVPLAQSGGLFTNQEVTVLGYGVGQIKDMVLTDNGVEVVLDIRGEQSVPAHAVVQILRRSALGEQAMNFIPVPADYQPPAGRFYASQIEPASEWQPAERGARIEPVLATFPTNISPLLDEAIALFEAIDTEDLGILVHELAAAFGGRAELLKELNRDSLDLSETLVSGIPEFERLLDTSEPVLAELNEHRESLASIWPEFADLSELLAAERPTIEQLIDTGREALQEGEALILNTRADQHCLFNDFRDLNALVAQPENLNDLSRGLRQQQFFYQGADLLTQWDPYRPGIKWQRINFLIFEHFGGQDYVPDRPTPQTKPGAACRSPWGVGVNAVRQADHQPPDPTAPPIDFAPLVEGGSQSRGATGSEPRAAGGAARASDGTASGDLPATGGGPTVIALAVLGLTAVLSRRLRRG